MRAAFLVAFICAGTLLTVSTRAAEAGIDLLVTDVDGNDASLDMEQQSLFAPPASASARFRTNASRETALRLSASADELPWIASVGFARLETANPELNLDILQMTLAGGVRTPAWPRRADRLGLRGHVMAGLAIASIEGEANLAGMRVPVSLGEFLFANNDPEVSPWIAAGLEWRFSRRLALLAEYHQCRFDFDGMATNSLILPTENTFARGSIANNGFGLGLRWLIGSSPARPTPGNPP